MMHRAFPALKQFSKFVQPKVFDYTASRSISTVCINNFNNSYNGNKLQNLYLQNSFPLITVKVPEMGDSITEGSLGDWSKNAGDYVEVDEVVCTIETDKTTNEILAPESGTLNTLFVEENDTVVIGQELFSIDEGVGKPAGNAEPEAKSEQKPEETKAAAPTPSSTPTPTPTPTPAPTPKAKVAPGGERREKMSRMRKRIAERLKDSQNTYATLTTFQECDMHNLMEMRKEFKDDFLDTHGVKLGFMSAFVKASAAALTEMPVINAVIEGDEILYRDYVDISVAVATPKGLVTPVLRDCDNMSFADVEKEIVALGKKARDGKIVAEDLTGGTFTISNGGVYGSMMGTPIINPPQSSILGMHGITKRPVVVNDEIVIRPMMYLALTYDHRLIDGRDAVTFLRKIKLGVEDPRRLLLEL